MGELKDIVYFFFISLFIKDFCLLTATTSHFPPPPQDIVYNETMGFYLSAPRSEWGQALVLGIHQGRIAGDLPTYIKMDISLGTVVEV